MLGLSLSKLVTLICIIVAVWTLFRWISRMTDARQSGSGRVGGGREQARGRAPRRPDPQPVEDLVACPGCGAYVAKGARACGRPNCPYPG